MFMCTRTLELNHVTLNIRESAEMIYYIIVIILSGLIRTRLG